MIQRGTVFTKDDMPEECGRPRIKVDRNTGLPLTVRGVKRGGFLNRQAIVHPKLEKDVTFYSVTETVNGPLVAISDGKATRYYWFGNNRRDTYMAQKGSSSFEEAWSNLFLSLMVDDRPVAKPLYDRVSFIFIEAFKLDPEKPERGQTFFGLRDNNGCEPVSHVTRSPKQGDRAMRVYLYGSTVKYLDLPMADHPLEAIRKAIRKR